MWDVPENPPPWPGLEATPEQIQAAAHALVRVPLPPDFTMFDMAKLAREVAMDINELSTILKAFKLTPAQYTAIEAHPIYQQTLAVETKQWRSATNTSERIKIEAAAMFEELMPSLYTRLKNPMENLSQVVEGAKLVAKVAGVGEAQQHASAPGEKFSITINLGQGHEAVRYEKSVNPTIEGSAQALQRITEGASNAQPLQQITEGA